MAGTQPPDAIDEAQRRLTRAGIRATRRQIEQSVEEIRQTEERRSRLQPCPSPAP